MIVGIQQRIDLAKASFDQGKFEEAQQVCRLILDDMQALAKDLKSDFEEKGQVKADIIFNIILEGCQLLANAKERLKHKTVNESKNSDEQIFDGAACVFFVDICLKRVLVLFKKKKCSLAFEWLKAAIDKPKAIFLIKYIESEQKAKGEFLPEDFVKYADVINLDQRLRTANELIRCYLLHGQELYRSAFKRRLSKVKRQIFIAVIMCYQESLRLKESLFYQSD